MPDVTRKWSKSWEPDPERIFRQWMDHDRESRELAMKTRIVIGISSIVLRATLAVVLPVLAPPLPAQSMGPGFRATVAIRASVMPRFSLREGPQPASAADQLVVASNAPSLRIRLVADAGPAGLEAARSGSAPAAGRPRLLLIVPD